MAQLKDLLVSGASRFLNKSFFNEKVTFNSIINQTFSNGTYSASSSSNGIIKPQKWIFDKNINPIDGDRIIIKTPANGDDRGVFLSLNNELNYYPIILNGAERLTTHYPSGSSIEVIFEANSTASDIYPLNGSSSRTNVIGGCWRVINYYDSGNGQYQVRDNDIYAKYRIYAGNIIVGTSSGYCMLKIGDSNEFDITYPPLYANSDIGQFTTGNDNYRHHYNISITITQPGTYTANKNVYIKGTLNGVMFKPISSTPLTQTIPTSEDGYVYYYIGRAYDTTNMTFNTTGERIYYYKNGAFRPYNFVKRQLVTETTDGYHDNWGINTYFKGNMADNQSTITTDLTKTGQGNGLAIYQTNKESSGIYFGGDYIAMWSPCDDYSLKYYDEDNGNLVWSISDSGNFSGSAARLTTSRTLWGQSFNGSANVSGDITVNGTISNAQTITSLTDSTYDIGSTTNHWRTGYFDKLLISSQTSFTSVSANQGYSGTSIQDGAIELSASTPYIDFHYNNAKVDYGVRIISNGTNRLQITGGTPESYEYNSRTISPLTIHSGIFYVSNSIETNTSFTVNQSSTGSTYGYFLRRNNAQYGRLYINSAGTAGSDASSDGSVAAANGTIGQAILEIGNSIAVAASSTQGVNNARGLIKLYGSTSSYTQIRSQSENNTGSYDVYLPRYQGSMYIAHAGSNDAIGSGTKPVYLAANGRVTASSSSVGSSTKPVYLSSGTLTASSGTVGSGTQLMYLSSGTLTASSSTVGSGTKPIFMNNGFLTASSSSIGSSTKPVYLSSGTLTASSSTVGSGTKPMYLSSGTLTASSETVGSSTKPMYLSSGTLTASSGTVGSGTQLMYLSSGTLTASSSTVGSGTKPIFMNNGILKASDSTIGSKIKPIYLSSGTITETDSTIGNAITPIYMENGEFKSCAAFGENFEEEITEDNYAKYFKKIEKQSSITTLAGYTASNFNNNYTFKYYTSTPTDSSSRTNYGKGWYNNNINVDSSVSNLMFEPLDGITINKIEIAYSIASEASYDFGKIILRKKSSTGSITSETLLEKAGTLTQATIIKSDLKEKEVNALIFTYKKDGSSSSNGDTFAFRLKIYGVRTGLGGSGSGGQSSNTEVMTVQEYETLKAAGGIDPEIIYILTE